MRPKVPPKTSSLDVSNIDKMSQQLIHSIRNTSTLNQQSNRWESSFIEALIAWPNLKVSTPEQLRTRLRRSLNVRRLVKLAAEFVVKSQKAYKVVDLEHAQALLDSAIELLVQARYILINPFLYIL